MDDREVPPGVIGPPDVNYGQHWRWDEHARRQYTYVLPLDLFVSKISGWFEEYRREEIADGPFGVSDEEPQVRRFREAGYPTLPDLLREGGDLLADLIKLNDFMALHKLSEPMTPGASTYYSTNSVDQVGVGQGIVRVTGIAYENRLRR